MADGNKRYLGDVFINEDNYEYQKQFFKDIIESYQWKYGGKFDASTLQEKTPEDFATAEQGAKADTAILAPLLLGQKEILNVAESQYIFTDAIKIDRNPEIPNSSSCINLIKWFDSLDDNANLSRMLYTIYQNTIDITKNLENIKLDKSVYESFLSRRFNPIETTFNRVFQDAIDPNTQELTHKLNADMVNGLIFHLITQQAYDNLSSEKKSSPRDIYIIVDQLPGDYEDPMQWSMENGFEFQIDEGKFQYKNVHDDTWRDICTLTELLSGADVRELVQDIMEEDIDEVIENIQPADVERSWAEYPFLSSSLHGVYAKDLKINGTHNYISSALDNTDSLKYLDLDMNQILIDNEVLKSDGSPKINEINNYFTQQISNHNDRITAINNSVSSLETQLGTDEENIASLSESLDNLGGTINSNKSRITNLENNIGKKQGSEFPLVYTEGSSSGYEIRLYSNGILGYVWIYWNQGGLSNAGYGEIRKHISLNNLNWIGTRYCGAGSDHEPYRCMGSHVTLDLSGRVQFLLNYDGKLYARSNTGQPITSDYFYATATYVCQGALRG